jgi:cell wall-associated NlpC family hydrolase
MQGVLSNKRVGRANQKGANGTYDFNCWGATLYVLNVSRTLTWVEEHVMQEFLVKRTDKIKTEDIQEGDIFVMYGETWFGYLQHTAVYIGEGMYFHKRGSKHSEITNLEDIFEIYPYNPADCHHRRLRK